MLSTALFASGGAWVGLLFGLHVVEREHSVDVDDGESGRVAVHLELLGSASELQLVVQLDVGKRVSVDGSALSAHDEGVGTCGDAADHVVATDVGLLPALLVVDAVGVWQLFDVERVLFSLLLLLFLLK